MSDDATVVYRVDPEDAITWVNGAWDEYALANAGRLVFAEGTVRSSPRLR